MLIVNGHQSSSTSREQLEEKDEFALASHADEENNTSIIGTEPDDTQHDRQSQKPCRDNNGFTFSNA
jgi:hypothetical protein